MQIENRSINVHIFKNYDDNIKVQEQNVIGFGDNVHSERGCMSADWTKFKLVLFNLIQNSIKYN